MIVEDVKKALYNILTQDLGYTVVDNSTEENDCPWIRLRTSNLYKQPFKDKEYSYNITYVLDIFSDYDGELEILQIEQNIFNNINQLYSIDGVSRVSGSTLHLFDDKSTGVLIKRGSIVYDITLAGEENVNE